MRSATRTGAASTHRLFACSLFVALLLFAGCDGRHRSPTQPFTPSGGSTSASGAPANWAGDATVVSATGGGGCGWGTQVGERRQNVLWNIVEEGDAITLEVDMDNWPTDHVTFVGSRIGQQFTARSEEPGLYVCQFRGGDLSGTFTADGLGFEAEENLVWGSGERETSVRRHWVGRKL